MSLNLRFICSYQLLLELFCVQTWLFMTDLSFNGNHLKKRKRKEGDYQNSEECLSCMNFCNEFLRLGTHS